MRRHAWTWLLVGSVLWWITAPAFATDTVYYYSSDTVHSEVVVTDQNRNVVERTYYAPYGQVLNRDLRDGPGYSGHEEDPETGLVYMQQRYYCPECGRFLSVDPVGVDPTNGGNFNRYEYASDNPYSYVDPDGEADQPIAAPGPCNAGSGCARGGDQAVPQADKKQEVAKAKEGMPKSKFETLATITVTAIRVAAAELPEIALPAAAGLLTYTAYPITLIAIPSNLAPSDCGDGRCAMMSEHTKGTRPSTEGKHEKGKTRNKRDAGNEKGDGSRRPLRKRPPDYRGGPWPPQESGV